MREGQNECGAETTGAAQMGDARKLPEAMREKTWEECGIEQKVERIRGVLLDTRRWLQSLQEQQHMVPVHQHGGHGEVLVEQAWGANLGDANYPPGYRKFDPLA